MKTLVYYILMAGILISSLLFISCSDKDTHEYRIGVSQCSGGFWRQKQNNEMLRELLLQESATMELRCAEDNDEKQIEDIQYFIDQKVDILIVSPHDTNALTDVIAKAYDAGIPVLLFDRIIDSDKYTAFVGGDNEGVGSLMAAYVATRLDNKSNVKVIEITGDMQTSPALLRHKGFMKGISEAPNIQVVASVDGLWLGPRSSEVADSLLRLYPDVDAIVAHSDYMADMARKVADTLYPGNNCLFVGADGFGAPGLGIEAVVKGKLDATAIYPTEGDVIIQTALKILKGEKYDRRTLLQSYLVSTSQEATLLISMDRALTAEVKRVERMHSRAILYLQESQKERVMLYVSLAVLALICGLCVALYRMNLLRRKSNKKLYEQQNKLIEQNGQLLNMTKELEEATNAKLVFFTNISHDFRTPLNLIAAPVEEAIKKLHNNDGMGVLPLLHIVRRNTGVLLDLVNQILDFRKVENGKMQLKLQTVDINSLMRSWHESFSSLAQTKGISLDFTAGEGECLVRVDAKKLERMVYNLLGNSIKFTPQGGRISLQCTNTDEALSITVSDTGQGIDKENLNRIFERFYQIGNNTEEGTGIGLALVKKYSELMGGRVEIESSTANDNPGKSGTRITIIIPAFSEDDSTNEESTASAPGAAITNNLSPDSLLACSDLPSVAIANEQHVTEDETRPVAMVIDDNADMRSFISSLLSDSYRVLTAVNGEQGLQMARENVPDIVICDVMMPVMDGLECCKSLKNDVCTSHIPVILLTACSLDEQRVSGLNSGAEVYLAKPFNSSVLLAQVDTLLKNRVRVHLSKAADIKSVSKKQESSPDVDQHIDEQSLSRYDRGFLKNIHEYVENNYGDENFNVEILADKMCLSRTQLYRKCKALTGISPVEMIRNTRLEHAREMLLNGYDSIANVATAVGIPNAPYFTKCYKAYFGDYPKNTMS